MVWCYACIGYVFTVMYWLKTKKNGYHHISKSCLQRKMFQLNVQNLIGPTMILWFCKETSRTIMDWLKVTNSYYWERNLPRITFIYWNRRMKANTNQIAILQSYYISLNKTNRAKTVIPCVVMFQCAVMTFHFFWKEIKSFVWMYCWEIMNALISPTINFCQIWK